MLALILVGSIICTPVTRGTEEDSYGKLRPAIGVINITFLLMKIFQLDDLITFVEFLW